PEDIYQEFLSEEYAEFMHLITRFHVQDPLANAFIRFFNKYSNRDDHLLPSTLQSGWAFIEDLNLPNFGWRKETIFKYEGLEYMLEFRTVLDGIHQLLINKSITEEFIFKYKSSFDN
ncbi:10870_t:CDS:1, partial [Cetraspora pellucida]